MASNTDDVKKLHYNMSVLCLYLCVCMSVASIGPISKPHLQNSHNFLQCPLLLLCTPLAALQYVMYFRFCGWCHVMTQSQKPLHRATLFASAVYAVVRDGQTRRLSVTSRCVSKRLNGSSWFRYGTLLPLCCKEVRVSPKIKVFPLQLCPKLCPCLRWHSAFSFLPSDSLLSPPPTLKISPGQFSRVVNKVHWRWSLLTTLTTVDVWLDAHTHPCLVSMALFSAGSNHICHLAAFV